MLRKILFITAVFCFSGPLRPLAASITNQKFFSEHLGKEWTYSIFLPEGYYVSGEEAYPVIYFLHGMYNSNHTFDAHGFDKILLKAIADGDIEPAVLVFPNGFRYSWWLNSEEYGAVEDAFIHDLIPHIESSYRVAAARSRRVVGGISMGGAGALYYALKYPALFNTVILFSPAVYFPFPDDELPNSRSYKTGWRYKMVINNTLSRGAFGKPFNREIYTAYTYPAVYRQYYLKQPYRLHFYLYYGDSDTITDNATENLIDFFHNENINAEIIELAGGHAWSLWRQAIAMVLKKPLFG
jgi:enterochelin esterase-like enzyme